MLLDRAYALCEMFNILIREHQYFHLVESHADVAEKALSELYQAAGRLLEVPDEI